MRRTAPVAAGALTLALWVALAPHAASAESERWSFRSSAGPALMISEDQRRDPLSFDAPGMVGSLHAAHGLRPWLELRASAHAGGYWSSTQSAGGLLGGLAGARLLLPRTRVAPYVAFDAGAGATGVLLRPLLLLSAGIDLQLPGRYTVGPVFGYGHLVQWNGPGYSTDGGYLWFGLSLAAKLGRSAAAPPGRVPHSQPRAPRQIGAARATERVGPPAGEPIVREPDPDVLAMLESALPARRIELLAPVLFALDSDELEPIGIAMLHEVAATLAQRPDVLRLQIEGYADARGSAEHNRALSQRRADRVRAWLVEHGVAPERLTTEPRGATQLIERGADEGAHLQNRRVVFRVLEAAP